MAKQKCGILLFFEAVGLNGGRGLLSSPALFVLDTCVKKFVCNLRLKGSLTFLFRRPQSWIVADFGCGEALISASVSQKVHSFDLCALNERITVCNMTSVPLENHSVDVAVFCLSLMGTNIVDFLVEAGRVLRVGGILKIAEVGSRFENIKQFIHKIERLGFELLKKKSGEKNYFVMFEFKKTPQQPAKAMLPEIKLKPCAYKKR